jgi:AraC family transcriptional regulator
MECGDRSGRPRRFVERRGTEGIVTIITPSEVPKYVPGTVTAASDDLG